MLGIGGLGVEINDDGTFKLEPYEDIIPKWMDKNISEHNKNTIMTWSNEIRIICLTHNRLQFQEPIKCKITIYSYNIILYEPYYPFIIPKWTF
jgi:hypothetical protein